tara:strand:- start:288 stop:536 length:249 start_codon:yes stop_codon:yes gene_type:complete
VGVVIILDEEIKEELHTRKKERPEIKGEVHTRKKERPEIKEEVQSGKKERPEIKERSKRKKFYSIIKLTTPNNYLLNGMIFI